MPTCSNATCGKSWTPEDQFPLCVTNPCPLRAVRREMVAEETRKPFFDTGVSIKAAKGAASMAPGVGQSLTAIRKSTKRAYKPYDMRGAQSARTFVRLRNGTEVHKGTHDQMHAEIRMIEWMVSEGHWTLYLGQIVWAHDHSDVTADQFWTKEPHCGFCTVILLALGLPVGQPTLGNYNQAGRLAYKLPDLLLNDPYVIARVIDSGCYCGFPALKRLLNAFVNMPADDWILSIKGLAYADDVSYVAPGGGKMIVEWGELVAMHRSEIVYLAWKLVFSEIWRSNTG